ncbi:hypothetical protein [Caenimonas soli]|uniref:hypothetical protein n=1 Tax=Caenimonas soli TaxID=2735555 RepID=UPI001551939B|nr:hypothetical protein [Caenimonas soli]NPC57013.1 hypothetical protein [Caenimonas soli]
MARLLVQSASTGRFLCPSLEDGQPEWVVSLREAGGGVVADVETAYQLVLDNCEPDDQPILIDLDRLGTFNDYPPQGEAAAALRVAGGAGGAAVSSVPDGNHGDNDFSGVPV